MNHIKNYDIIKNDLKRENKIKLLKEIFLAREITRKELSLKVNLSLSSVTRLMNELIEQRYIVKKKKVNDNRYGRKSEVFSVNKNKYKFFVVDLDVKNTIYGYGNFDGEVEILKTVKTPETIKELLESIEHNIKLFDYKCDAISLSIPGIINLEKKFIINAPNLNWKNVSFSDYKNYNLIIENDSNLSILAEKIFSKKMQNVKNAAYILIKDGIGAGLMLEEKIYRGYRFSAGEIGHNIFKNDKKIQEFEKIKEENNKDFLDILALNISYAVNLLNLEKVIIGGKFINYQSEMFNKVKSKILEYTFKECRDVEIILTEFNYVPASLAGACSNAILKYIESI